MTGRRVAAAGGMRYLTEAEATVENALVVCGVRRHMQRTHTECVCVCVCVCVCGTRMQRRLRCCFLPACQTQGYD